MRRQHGSLVVWSNRRSKLAGERIETALQQAIGDPSDLVVRIPDWQPTDFDSALSWVRAQVYEGFEVDFLTEGGDGAPRMLWLKSWEYWDPEDPSEDAVPTWETVKAVPPGTASG